MSGAMIVDEDRIRELEDDFGAEDLAEIIEAFLEEASEAVEALAPLLSDVPSEERKDQFHFLAGAARNLGAVAFGDLSKRLEEENGPFGADDFAAFRAEFQRVSDHFQAADGVLRQAS